MRHELPTPTCSLSSSKVMKTSVPHLWMHSMPLKPLVISSSTAIAHSYPSLSLVLQTMILHHHRPQRTRPRCSESALAHRVPVHLLVHPLLLPNAFSSSATQLPPHLKLPNSHVLDVPVLTSQISRGYSTTVEYDTNSSMEVMTNAYRVVPSWCRRKSRSWLSRTGSKSEVSPSQAFADCSKLQWVREPTADSRLYPASRLRPHRLFQRRRSKTS